MSVPLGDTLDRMIDAAGGGGGGADAGDFIPSASFGGSREGYVFRAGERGTGYYADRKQATADAADENGAIGQQPATKRRRMGEADHDDETGGDGDGGGGRRVQFQLDAAAEVPTRKTPEELLAEAEVAAAENAPASSIRLTLDRAGVTRLASSLVKCRERNQLARAEHPDDPARFVDSELALHDELTSLQGVAAQPSLYKHLVAHEEFLPALLGLFAHENIDVVLALVETLNELLDVGLLSDKGDGGAGAGLGALGRALLDPRAGGGADNLVATLGRFELEEEEEDVRYRGIFGTLTLLETLLDLDGAGVLREAGGGGGEDEEGGDRRSPSAVTEKIDDSKHKTVVSLIWEGAPALVAYLLEQIGKKRTPAASAAGTDREDARYHSSELLATILQHEDSRSPPPSRRGAPYPSLGSVPAFSPQSAASDDAGNGEKSDDKKGARKTETVDGIEMLLQAAAPYRRADPATERECEHVENCLDALAAAMLRNDHGDDDAVSRFVDSQGIELMLRCVQGKVHAGSGALRVLFYALSGNDDDGGSGIGDDDGRNGGDNGGKNKEKDGGQRRRRTNPHKRACEYFVDEAGGLGVLFPLLMGRSASLPRPAPCSDAGSDYLTRHQNGGGSGKRARRVRQAKRDWLHGVESNALNLVYSLTWHLDEESPKDAKARLLAKFVEADCEKCDRLVELFLKYDARMRSAEARYLRSEEAELAEAEGVDVDLAAFHAKLGGGGDLFHRIGAVLGFASAGSRRCHARILEQLRLNNSGISVVKAAIEEFASVLDDGTQKSNLERYLTVI